MSLLSRLCHFAARAHARTLGGGWKGGEGDGAVPRCKHCRSARSPRVHCPRAQSKLHCNRGCNRRAINQCPDHGCVLPISKSRAPPMTTDPADKTLDRRAVDDMEMKAATSVLLSIGGFDSISSVNSAEYRDCSER